MHTRTQILDAEEHELLLRLIAGDEEAFCDLYIAYKKKLICFAMHFLQSVDEAEDLFQDTFTSVWYNRRTIDPDASFSSYLFMIMRNKILNRLREQESQLRFLDSLANQFMDSGSYADQYLQINELQQLITEALQQLTPRQREIFLMSRKYHLSHKKIADTLSLSVNTVKDSISTSLHKIRAYLDKYSVNRTDLLLLFLFLSI